MNKNIERLSRYDAPKSFCVCGHTGDGPHSQHRERFAEGHGSCTICGCKQFLWDNWTLPFSRLLAQMKAEQEKSE